MIPLPSKTVDRMDLTYRWLVRTALPQRSFDSPSNASSGLSCMSKAGKRHVTSGQPATCMRLYADISIGPNLFLGADNLQYGLQMWLGSVAFATAIILTKCGFHI